MFAPDEEFHRVGACSVALDRLLLEDDSAALRTLEVTETMAEVNGRVMFADVKRRASRRTLSVPPFLLTMLSEHLAARGRPGPRELVLVAPEGGPLRRSTFRTRVFGPAVERAELEGLTFHGLRHTAVGLMIESGAHIEAIKQRLGHSSIRLTSDTYGSLLPTVDESVTAALEDTFGNFEDQMRTKSVPSTEAVPGATR